MEFILSGEMKCRKSLFTNSYWVATGKAISNEALLAYVRYKQFYFTTYVVSAFRNGRVRSDFSVPADHGPELVTTGLIVIASSL